MYLEKLKESSKNRFRPSLSGFHKVENRKSSCRIDSAFATYWTFSGRSTGKETIPIASYFVANQRRRFSYIIVRFAKLSLCMAEVRRSQTVSYHSGKWPKFGRKRFFRNFFQFFQIHLVMLQNMQKFHRFASIPVRDIIVAKCPLNGLSGVHLGLKFKLFNLKKFL